MRNKYSNAFKNQEKPEKKNDSNEEAIALQEAIVEEATKPQITDHTDNTEDK